MNKKDLERAIKNKFFINKIYYDLEIKKPYFYLKISNINPYYSLLISNFYFKNNKEKSLIYEYLIKLINEFDFSYSLEFEDLNKLKEFLE